MSTLERRVWRLEYLNYIQLIVIFIIAARVFNISQAIALFLSGVILAALKLAPALAMYLNTL